MSYACTTEASVEALNWMPDGTSRAGWAALAIGRPNESDIFTYGLSHLRRASRRLCLRAPGGGHSFRDSIVSHFHVRRGVFRLRAAFDSLRSTRGHIWPFGGSSPALLSRSMTSRSIWARRTL